MAKYIQDFFSLKCSGDVLNAVSPIGNRAEKEITEALAILKSLRGFILKSSTEYNILDLCSGNALVPVLSAFLFPISKATAIDKKYRDRKWYLVKKFQYVELDIYDDRIYEFVDSKTIITAVHPCKNLAKRTIEIYQKSEAEGLIIMPCCEGSLTQKYPQYIKDKLPSYDLWTWELANLVEGNIHKDIHCLSPKNLVIEARK